MPVGGLLGEGLGVWTPSLERTLHGLILGSAFHPGQGGRGAGSLTHRCPRWLKLGLGLCLGSKDRAGGSGAVMEALLLLKFPVSGAQRHSLQLRRSN